MIHLDKQDSLILRSILQKYPYKFYAYGSRTKDNYKKFSDLDLCIMENISDEQLFALQNALEESDISIKIDVKRWFIDMNAGFRSLIEKDITPLSPKN
ncbi:nucleotidyltransferase domain-containing protein [Rickettsia endosymbiont of Polydrusus tereticollis]|uniref:nucleotidyltransferase domain-containing protein n=1 Tax=Rickettsia endosymbiont of Polydrusus tereticollis TaxID=3066251 RepID=UPI003132B777